ncbi:YheC/YheD family protein [Pontibacillus salicampi]|uniref:YheC/YheD family protein n=1 Tax=Pontibacillus salicampi TaxID=1449801 RepID=A0ABV6LLV1_9BACI
MTYAQIGEQNNKILSRFFVAAKPIPECTIKGDVREKGVYRQMTLIGMLHHRKDPETVIKSYAYAIVAKAEGADFIYFTPSMVHFGSETISGLVYEDGKWKPRRTRFPDVIYNTGSPEKLSKAMDVLRKLKEKVPFTTHSIGNKWRVNERLKEAGDFAQYLIPSKVVKTPKELLHFMEAFSDVVVKPVDGRKGQDIYYITKEQLHFIVNQSSHEERWNLASFINRMTDLLSEKAYIVQPYIRSRTKSGLAYDFRIHVQKDGAGKWVNTAIYPRIAPEGTIITNINNGGYTNYLDPFLHQEFQQEAFNIKKTLEYFGLALARHLDELQMVQYQEVIDEIGIDVGLDTQRKLWIYEVNWRPGCPPTFYLEMDVVRNTILYAMYLAQYQEKIKREILAFKQKKMKKRDIPIIAVTGSAGKTTTKSFLASVLSTRWNVFESKDYWNTTEHTQKHAEEISHNHEAVVLEYGMAYPGVITEHCSIIQPNISIVTNIGMAHIGNFDGDVKGIAHAKSELIHGMKQDGLLVINKDNEHSQLLEMDQFKGRIITTGIYKDADYRASRIAYADNGMTFSMELQHEEHELFIPIFGEHHVYNAMNAVAIADQLGFSPIEIKSGLLFKKPPRRMTMYHLNRNMTMIDDTVHSHPQAVMAAVDVLANIAKGRTIAILGQMRELGDLRDAQYQHIGEYVAEKNIDMVVTYGYRADAIGIAAKAAGIKEEMILHFLDKEKMHEALMERLQDNDTILVKGASKTHMFDTVKFLSDTIGEV